MTAFLDRSCATLLATCMASLTPGIGHSQPPPAPTPKVAAVAEVTVSARTIRACSAIAVIANRGTAALKAADLSRRGHGQMLDLSNDGHPRLVHFDTEGTAHGPVLEDEHGNDAWDGGGWGSLPEAVRWADELSVLKAEGRTWVISWDGGSNPAVLDGATDGHVTCEFKAEWLPPKVGLLPGGRASEMRIYQDLLFGKGQAPPRITFHDVPRLPASLQGDVGGGNYGVEAEGWRVDLDNSGHPLTLAGVGYGSGAGAGCEFSQLGLVRDGMVVAVLLGDALPPILPLGGTLDRSLKSDKGVINFFDYCTRGAYTPVLDEHGRAYVILDDTKLGKHITSNAVRVLAGAQDGKLQLLARLVWTVRNRLAKVAGP